uniref:Uncharacterized protein n=1 Tax=Skeletonema marinoi TaxID=267567 RepID=A0A7S2PU29_9STRA
MSQKDGNFVPFNDMGNNNCGTDGVFILMSHQPVHGGERVSYIGRLPDEATAKKETKADGAIEGTAFTHSTIDKWNKLGGNAMLELNKYLTKQEKSTKSKNSKSTAAKSREKARVEKRKLEEEEAEREREVKRQRRQRIEDLEISYMTEQRVEHKKEMRKCRDQFIK